MANPRAEFSPIFHRPPLKLPNNARVAIWPVINVEEWDINATDGPRRAAHAPRGSALIPDIANFGWFDYGLRVGFWRFKQVLDKPQHPGHGEPQRVGVPQLPPCWCEESTGRRAGRCWATASSSGLSTTSRTSGP